MLIWTMGTDLPPGPKARRTSLGDRHNGPAGKGAYRAFSKASRRVRAAAAGVIRRASTSRSRPRLRRHLRTRPKRALEALLEEAPHPVPRLHLTPRVELPRGLERLTVRQDQLPEGADALPRPRARGEDARGPARRGRPQELERLSVLG